MTITNNTQYGFALLPVMLGWTASTGAAGYSIERKLVGTTTWTAVGSVGPTVTSFSDTTATDGSAYMYRVNAIDANGATAGLNVGPVTAVGAAGDFDVDGLNNQAEIAGNASPGEYDTDGDLLPDPWEVANALNPQSADGNSNGIPDANEDFDGDGASNSKEAEAGTGAGTADTDGDGASDGFELANRGNPRNAGDGGVVRPADTVRRLHAKGRRPELERF